ncbi:MAG: glycosyltransferase family 2 protein, partial [Pirellula sp.]|nr:glycosyltransferase family 2 protein [Pirellula sp.]
MKISFLIPAFNEEPTIGKVLDKVLQLPFSDREIIVVDDASSDRTPQIVQDYQAKFDCVKLIRQTTNGGKTSAIDLAIQQASGDVLIIQDADLEYDPDEIPDIVAPILSDVADVVYGSRFLVKRASRVLYFYHYLANKGLTFFSNVLTNRNMSDIETCYKAFRKEVIKPIKLTSTGFGMEVEITAMVCKTRARTYEV